MQPDILLNFLFSISINRSTCAKLIKRILLDQTGTEEIEYKLNGCRASIFLQLKYFLVDFYYMQYSRQIIIL